MKAEELYKEAMELEEAYYDDISGMRSAYNKMNQAYKLQESKIADLERQLEESYETVHDVRGELQKSDNKLEAIRDKVKGIIDKHHYANDVICVCELDDILKLIKE